MARGYRKSGVRLWTHLTHSREPATAQTVEQLLDLLRRADFEPPAQLLHWLLVGPWAARFKLVARLGREANDPIDELLNAAMAYATGQVPSLVGFLQWFDSGDGELKREAGQAADLVRVMTVHGSKGLQAPIVILADAADDPDASLARGVELVEQGPGQRPRTVPLPALRKEEKGGPVRAAEEQAAREERAEHWRLLYVALTRAEEALFIAGAWPPSRKELPVDSWYARLAPLFGEDTAWEPDPIWDGARSIGMPGPVVKTATRGGETVALPLLPPWLTTPIGPEPRPPRPLAPSALGEDEAPDPPTRPGPGALEAARRGTLIHKLIERLPAVAPDEREAAALAWLARQAAEFDAAARAEMLRAALAVLDHPDWQAVFGPGSLAEVPLAAVVEGRVVSGTIDRLLITPERVLIVDFKTARRPPASLDEVPLAYLRQMAAYAAALAAIHPDRTAEAALLYTHAPHLIAVPAEVLARHRPVPA
ncbi:PD-(D/E)XK nuclease family protein [Novosphingobium pokkalii]|uniref:PD-(D/E)XK nuclease family protein n=1 Tax=Novosphingobium pokkalii TaxID=1770194 RepID=UPI0036434B69